MGHVQLTKIYLISTFILCEYVSNYPMLKKTQKIVHIVMGTLDQIHNIQYEA